MAEKRRDNKGRVLQKGETQRKDGRYLYQYTDKNGKRRSIYAWDLADLRDKEKQIVIDDYEGIDSGKADTLTVNDLFERFIEGKKRIRVTTWVGYKYNYDKYVRDRIGSMTLSAVKYSTIEGLYNYLLDNVLSYGTLGMVNNILHAMFDLALRDDIIRKNPTSGLMKKLKNTHELKNEKRIALTPEEQEAFVNYVKGNNGYDYYMPLFTFLLGTGCRIGEAIGLTWDDVDFKAGTISINHALVYKPSKDGKVQYTIAPPKSEAGIRTIPMLQDVRKALLQQKERLLLLGRCKEQVGGYSDFVFMTNRRTIVKPSCLNKVINNIVRDHNEAETRKAEKEGREPIIIRHFSAHNLRHTFATNYCQVENNLKTIQEIMGHSDISITMNIYAECTAEAKKTSFENLEGKFKIG